MYGGRFSIWMKNQLRQMGYEVNFRVLNAADFGVPQLLNERFLLQLDSMRLLSFQNLPMG